jgi:peroxiredoxin
MAPFTLPTPDGGTYSLGERARGRVTLVNYWATWCPPCRRETTTLVRLYDRYRVRGLEVVGVSLDTDHPAESVARFAGEFGVTYPLALAADDPGIALLMGAVPVTVLLDRQGRMAKTITGPVDERALPDDVERLLGEPATP